MRRIMKNVFTFQDGHSSPPDSFSRCRLLLLHVSLHVKKTFQEMITVVTDFEHLLFPFYCIFCGGNASKSWVMAWTSFPEHTCDEYLQPKGTRKPFVFIGDFCVFRRHFSLFFKWVSSVEMNLKHFVVLKATCWSFHWYKYLIDNFFFAFPFLALGTINKVFDWHMWVIFLHWVKLRAKHFLDQLKRVSCQKSFRLFPKFWGYL